jgi:hypothetical protein
MAAAPGDCRVASRRLCRQLEREAGFSDARLAGQKSQAAVPVTGCVERGAQRFELAAPANENLRLSSHPMPLRRRCYWHSPPLCGKIAGMQPAGNLPANGQIF